MADEISRQWKTPGKCEWNNAGYANKENFHLKKDYSEIYK